MINKSGKLETMNLEVSTIKLSLYKEYFNSY